MSLVPLLLLGAALVARADDAKPAPAFSLGVHEAHLENGLEVLTVERPGAPRATCWLFMKTGSVNEHTGITGISHLFEHLMFKGTHTIGVKDYARDQKLQLELDAAWQELRAADAGTDDAKKVELVKRFKALQKAERENDVQDELWDLYLSNGGTGLNAFTTEDMTVYIVTLPSNKVELFMWLESDRLAHAVFREFYAERDVVKEERRLDENRPEGPFEEQLYATFFMAMPYHWPVLGWMSDLDAITPADCRAYFDIFYAPNNAALVVVGDVKHEEVEKLAERYFGRIPRGKVPPPAIRTVEPRPCGERRVTVEKKDARPRATLIFHCPRRGEADGP
ncbi:MAG TPA: pitrilysin family protein, partial [Planctomycetota bacterium]|nr:pitrilysin family protein [Planctomycetota bacterium]